MKNYTITVNGVAYDVTVEENKDGVRTIPVPAPVASTPAATLAPAKAPAPSTPAAPVQSGNTGSTGSLKVNSPMPGKILAIKATIGQSVKRGDVILILEAMKMENEIVSPEDGAVASINVANGDMVEAGVLLATLN